MRVHSEESHARRVDPRHDQICPDVPLVPEQVLLEHRHHRHHPRLAAGRQRVELEVGGDQGGREFSIGCCARTGAPYLWGDVVQFLTVLSNVFLAT